MANILFIALLLIGIIYSLFTNRFYDVTNVLLESPISSFYLFVEIYALLIFWGGILEIVKDNGLLKILSKLVIKIIHPLFKNLDKDSLALQYIAMNLIANMLSMGSAATPFGLKAMKELQKNSNDKEDATPEMITFLLINTSGVCLIPTTVIAIRNSMGSTNPVAIVTLTIIISIIVTITAILFDLGVKKLAKS